MKKNKKNNDNKTKHEINMEMSVTAIAGEPETAFDMVNKYGTYEIQPTADTDNEFPAIAQGEYIEPENLKTHAESETKN
ncbi:MAG: hypothetical protein U0L17_00795 [Acutalibacteraceae bacterium]|nr:hypothetical protein [Acutalibacteraceae bacterium]